METWLLLTAYRELTAPYPVVLSPTFYDLPFSHNTFVTDGDDGRTDGRTITVPYTPIAWL